MDGARNQLFACSCFTRDEDRRITWRDFGDARENTFQCGRCSNDLFKHRGFVDFFAQSDVLAAKRVFRLLAFFDVSSNDVPASEASFFVSERVKSEKKPTIIPIFSRQARFGFERLVAEEFCSTRSGQDTVMIIRVNQSVWVIILPCFTCKTVIVKPGLVQIHSFPIRPQDSHVPPCEI